MHEAALFGKLDVVKLLLTRGANPHVLDPQHRTALELAKQLDTPTSKNIAKHILGGLFKLFIYVRFYFGAGKICVSGSLSVG